MTPAEQLAILESMGLTLYVPHAFDEAVFTPPVAALKPLAEDLKSAPSTVSQYTNENTDLNNKPKPVAPLIALEDTPTKILKEPITQLTPPAKQQTITPFHWLIAHGEFVNFVCDIKHARLQGVWHAAAAELLGDIAIAVGDKKRLRIEYFSWPLAGDLALGDDDLPDFLSSFLVKQQTQPIYIVLGTSAAEYIPPLMAENAPCVIGDALGQMFKHVKAKKSLWQSLKPLARH